MKAYTSTVPLRVKEVRARPSCRRLIATAPHLPMHMAVALLVPPTAPSDGPITMDALTYNARAFTRRSARSQQRGDRDLTREKSKGMSVRTVALGEQKSSARIPSQSWNAYVKFVSKYGARER